MEQKKSKIWNEKPDLKIRKSIRSEYNLKEIFSFLKTKRLFNLIIYNKHLQELFKINLDDYKNISGKYKIGKKDGEGKIYTLFENILIFKGQYLNGKKNGNGKEYYENGEFKFEGEYLDGKRWNGKGEIYNEFDELEFEGEYLEGKRWEKQDIKNGLSLRHQITILL